MNDIVTIKGLKYGLQLTFAKGASFDDVKANLLDKLQSGNSFFLRGTTVFIPKGYFAEDQNEILRRMFHRHGMLFSTDLKRQNISAPSNEIAKPVVKTIVNTVREPVNDSANLMVINRTIRGGQEVKSNGSVLICGNVNPGAQVIAGGSIDIRGTCRGFVHAGAFGDKSAFVLADRLMPLQIRIADFVARAPDEPEDVNKAERAMIKDNMIVFEPVAR
ncbi:MAG: septum site-determining protein MinC [Selenomonadaceae bacterium]|nr:septum site-determining protein MinC [Selenomonadaceae bacterium]